MKFAASYSGGKDSTLAIYKAIQEGHAPVLLITTFNLDRSHSYSHGIDEIVLNRISASLGIPYILVKTRDADYKENFENALVYAKSLGAQACVFGDIDIEGHFDWCNERCGSAGLKHMVPLWGMDRKSVVYEFIDSGFIADISVVNTDYLSEDLLGRRLTKETAGQIAAKGVDICGENGEYHTFVYDGPMFKHPIEFVFGEKIIKDKYAFLLVQDNASTIRQSYKFFNNRACKYFPCHETQKPDELNCLFCFCPLYAMDDKCGGIFEYTKKGVKVCMNCSWPHNPESYSLIMDKLKEWRPEKC